VHVLLGMLTSVRLPENQCQRQCAADAIAATPHWSLFQIKQRGLIPFIHRVNFTPTNTPRFASMASRLATLSTTSRAAVWAHQKSQRSLNSNLRLVHGLAKRAAGERSLQGPHSYRL
jgi:hypothetical protein